MKCLATRYTRHQFPAEILEHAVRPYYRFNLSDRDIEDLLAQRGIVITHKLIRQGCNKFGPRYALRLRCAHLGYGDTFLQRPAFPPWGEPRTIVTDKLKSCTVARREHIAESIQKTSRHANNGAELSHQPTRVRERGLRRIKSMPRAQRFVRAHAAVSNLLNRGRHLVAAGDYRTLRQGAFASWHGAAAI